MKKFKKTSAESTDLISCIIKKTSKILWDSPFKLHFCMRPSLYNATIDNVAGAVCGLRLATEVYEYGSDGIVRAWKYLDWIFTQCCPKEKELVHDY